MPKQNTPELPKPDKDNRANQLNTNNPAFWGSRGQEKPVVPGGNPPPPNPPKK